MQNTQELFNDKEKAYILENCQKMTIRQLEASLKQQDFCLLYGDVYSKIHSFLKRHQMNFKRENLSVHEQKGLTEREVEILELISKGIEDKKIAEKLFISMPTTKTHINNIVQKLGFDGNPKHIIRVRMVLWYLKNIKKMEIDYDRK